MATAPKGKVAITVTPMYHTDQKTDYFNLNCEEEVHIKFGELTYVSPKMAAYIDSIKHHSIAKVQHREDNAPSVEHEYVKKFNVAYQDDAEIRTQRECAKLRMNNEAKDKYITELKKRIEKLEADPKVDKFKLNEAKGILEDVTARPAEDDDHDAPAGDSSEKDKQEGDNEEPISNEDQG